MAIQRVPVPLVGGSDKASAEVHEAGRSVNLYVEIINGKPALKAAPGFFRWLDIDDFLEGSPVIRGLHTMGDRLFCVVGNKVGEIYPNNTIVFLATLNTSTGRVGMSDNAGNLIVGDGLFWLIDPNLATIAQILTAEGDQIEGYISRWINGTSLYFGRDSSSYYYSEVGAPQTVLGLSFFSAEANPDKILNAYVVADQIVILGEKSTEWHVDTGDANNPFQRIQGGFIDTGCAARWASCKFDNTVIMVSQSEHGGGKIVRLGGAGAAPQIISNGAVEGVIAKVLFSFTDLTRRVSMWSYEEAGHSFAVLNLPAATATVNNLEQPSMTWVFDAAVPPQYAWSERGYWNPDTGAYERGLSEHHAYWRKRHYTGAYNAPIIYEMSLDYYRENTEELIKRREVGPINPAGDASMWSCKYVDLLMERGVGRDGDVQGSDPKVMMQYRWGTAAWSNEIERKIGKLGEGQRTAIRFGPAGRGEQLSLRFSISDPVRVIMTGCFVGADR